LVLHLYSFLFLTLNFNNYLIKKNKKNKKINNKDMFFVKK